MTEADQRQARVSRMAMHIKETTGLSWREIAEQMLIINESDLIRAFELSRRDPDKGTLVNPTKLVIDLCTDMKWSFALSTRISERDIVNGIIMGTPPFVDKAVNILIPYGLGNDRWPDN